MNQVDFLIVGAGLAGCVLAERLSSLGRKVLIVEKRNHIGGNCYDFIDNNGVLVHKYGPHYFRTNNDDVIEYLSQFTDWIKHDFKVKAYLQGKLYPIPVNRDTINLFFNKNLKGVLETKAFLDKKRTRIKKPKNAEEQVLSVAGKEIYEAFFKSYTIKQWDMHPKNLDASVTARIPIRTNNDNRYFTDKFQGLPRQGYTNMFKKLCQNCEVLLNTDYQEIKNKVLCDKLIFTGQIDSFFDYKFGKLPYRSLKINFERYEKEYYQDWLQINYPNDYKYTRIVEMKHATGQKISCTTISKEYPTWNGEPYYPVPNLVNENSYQKYKKEANKLSGVFFVGRLAQYKYLNMDEVVGKALTLSKSLSILK
jgi:UDP-galactopyranose mutase